MAICIATNNENIAPTCNIRAQIEKQMHTHPHVQLGQRSKDTAHVCIDTCFFLHFDLKCTFKTSPLRSWCVCDALTKDGTNIRFIFEILTFSRYSIFAAI